MPKKNKRLSSRKRDSYTRKTSTREVLSGKKPENILISLINLDRNQGQTYAEWEKDKVLSNALEKLTELCQFTVIQAIANGLIKEYKNVEFPPESDFVYPRHIKEGVTWCSCHIQGKECIIGYFDDNIFNIV